MPFGTDAASERRFSKGSGLLLALIIIAEVTVASDFSLASIALPSIERGLGLAPVLSQWVITSDLLAYAGLLIIAGRVADICGQKRTLTFGLSVFLAGTILASLSFNAPMLIAARALQGMGGAFSYPAAFSLLTISFREGPQRFRAYTINMAAASAGIPLVTMFVGWSVTRFGWQSAFLFNVPMCLIVILGLRFLKLPQHQRPTVATRIPFASAILLTLGIAAVVHALPGYAAAKPGAALGNTEVLLAGAAILAVFAFTQLRTAAPLIPPGLLRAHNFVPGILVLSFGVLSGKAIMVLSNISLQRGLQLSPFSASLVLLPMIISSLALVPISGKLDRILLPYAKWVNCAAFTLLGVLYSVLSMASTTSALYLLAFVLFLCPFFTITNANLALSSALRSIAKESQGVATAITYTIVQVVTATGMAILITLGGHSGKTGAGFEQFSGSFRLGAFVCVLGVLFAAFGLRTARK